MRSSGGVVTSARSAPRSDGSLALSRRSASSESSTCSRLLAGSGSRPSSRSTSETAAESDARARSGSAPRSGTGCSSDESTCSGSPAQLPGAAPRRNDANVRLRAKRLQLGCAEAPSFESHTPLLSRCLGDFALGARIPGGRDAPDQRPRRPCSCTHCRPEASAAAPRRGSCVWQGPSRLPAACREAPPLDRQGPKPRRSVLDAARTIVCVWASALGDAFVKTLACSSTFYRHESRRAGAPTRVEGIGRAKGFRDGAVPSAHLTERVLCDRPAAGAGARHASFSASSCAGSLLVRPSAASGR